MDVNSICFEYRKVFLSLAVFEKERLKRITCKQALLVYNSPCCCVNPGVADFSRTRYVCSYQPGRKQRPGSHAPGAHGEVSQKWLVFTEQLLVYLCIQAYNTCAVPLTVDEVHLKTENY